MIQRPTYSLLIYLFSLIIITVPTMAWSAEAGQLNNVIRQVEIDGNAAQTGDVFDSGATVTTGDSSLAALRFTDGGSVVLKSNSVFKVDSYQYDVGQPDEDAFVVSLIRGGLRAVTGIISDRNKEVVNYKTPIATIGIRGTEFLLSLVNGVLFIEVIEGIIIVVPNFDNVGNTFPEVTLETGESLVISATGQILATGNAAVEMIRETRPFEGLQQQDQQSGVNSVYAWGPWLGLEQLEVTEQQSAGLPATSSGNPVGIYQDDLIQQDQTGVNIQNVIAQNNLDIPEAPSVDFVDVGGSGIVRGQITWRTNADIDLHMNAPGGGHVAFYNTVLSLNGGLATATLDQDNVGFTIDVSPDLRVENIAITGSVPDGNYEFWAYSFSGNNDGNPTAVTLTATGDNNLTSSTINPVLNDNEVSNTLVVNRNAGSITYSVQSPPLDPQP